MVNRLPVHPSFLSLDTRKTSGWGDFGCLKNVDSNSPNQRLISTCLSPLTTPWSLNINILCSVTSFRICSITEMEKMEIVKTNNNNDDNNNSWNKIVRYRCKRPTAIPKILSVYKAIVTKRSGWFKIKTCLLLVFRSGYYLRVCFRSSSQFHVLRILKS